MLTADNSFSPVDVPARRALDFRSGHTVRVWQKIKEGDKVRVYYQCNDTLLWSIKKMTPVEDLPAEYNRGYIYQRKTHGPE